MKPKEEKEKAIDEIINLYRNFNTIMNLVRNTKDKF